MPKGGHARSGPPPDPNALRRDRDQGEWTVLPAEGRDGPSPDWPLSAKNRREAIIWNQFWRKPQAVAWERLGQEYEVAMLVRNIAEAEQPDSPIALRTVVRQQMDSLGLTTPGLRSNRWRIARDEVAAKRADQAAAPAKAAGPTARDRLRGIAGGKSA